MVDRIILHAGTPKTGSTSLQIALEASRARLAACGLLYPSSNATPYPTIAGGGVKPKHQWLVECLMSDDDTALEALVGGALREAAPSVGTVVLSTEGLFNHWWDFSEAGRTALSRLSRRYQVELWVWFRDPVEFFASNYVQMLKNPSSSVRCYGQDWSAEQMLDDPWFARHLDYKGFVEQVTDTLGPGSVRVFKYHGDTIGDFAAAARIGELCESGVYEHATLGHLGVETLRLLNRRGLSTAKKQEAVNLVTQLEALLGEASARYAVDAPVRDRVLALSSESLTWLSQELGIDLMAPWTGLRSPARAELSPNSWHTPIAE